MATTGTIAIELEDGTVKEVYSHWDNYLENNGVLLALHYTERDQVIKLVNRGAISSLGTYVTDDPDALFDRPDNSDRYTIYYYMRSGDQCEFDPTTYESVEDYYHNGCDEDFNYLFNKYNEWMVKPKGGLWDSLELVLEELNNVSSK